MPAESGTSYVDVSKVSYIADTALYSPAGCTSPPYPQPKLQNPI